MASSRKTLPLLIGFLNAILHTSNCQLFLEEINSPDFDSQKTSASVASAIDHREIKPVVSKHVPNYQRTLDFLQKPNKNIKTDDSSFHNTGRISKTEIQRRYLEDDEYDSNHGSMPDSSDVTLKTPTEDSSDLSDDVDLEDFFHDSVRITKAPDNKSQHQKPKQSRKTRFRSEWNNKGKNSDIRKYDRESFASENLSEEEFSDEIGITMPTTEATKTAIEPERKTNPELKKKKLKRRKVIKYRNHQLNNHTDSISNLTSNGKKKFFDFTTKLSLADFNVTDSPFFHENKPIDTFKIIPTTTPTPTVQQKDGKSVKKTEKATKTSNNSDLKRISNQYSNASAKTSNDSEKPYRSTNTRNVENSEWKHGFSRNAEFKNNHENNLENISRIKSDTNRESNWDNQSKKSGFNSERELKKDSKLENTNNKENSKMAKNSKRFLEKPRIKGVVYRSTQRPRTKYNLESQKANSGADVGRDAYSGSISSHSNLNNPDTEKDYLAHVVELFKNDDGNNHQKSGDAFDTSGDRWLSKFQTNNHNNTDDFYMISYNFMGDEKKPEKDVVKFTRGKSEPVKKAHQPSEKKVSPKLSEKAKPETHHHIEEGEENNKSRLAMSYQFSKRHREYPPLEDVVAKDKAIITDSNNSNYRSPSTDKSSVSYKKKPVKQTTQPLWEQKKPLSNPHYDDGESFESYENTPAKEQNTFHRKPNKSYVSSSFNTFSGGNNKPLNVDFPSIFNKKRPMFGPQLKSNSDSSQSGKYFMQMFKRVGDVSLENFDPESENISEGDGYTSLMKLSWNDDDRRAQVEKTIDTRIPGYRMSFNHQYNSREDNLDYEKPEASETVMSHSFFPEEDYRWPTFEHFPEQQPVVFRTKRSNREQENHFFKYHYQMGDNSNRNMNLRDRPILNQADTLNRKPSYFPNVKHAAILNHAPSRNLRTSPSHEIRTYYRKPLESNDRKKLIDEFHDNNYRIKSSFDNYEKPARETQHFPAFHSYKTPDRQPIQQQKRYSHSVRLNTDEGQNNLNHNSYRFKENHDASPQTTFFNYRMPSEASTVRPKVEPGSDNVRLNTDGRQNNLNHNSYRFNENHNASPQTTFFNHRMPSEASTIRSKLEPERDNVRLNTDGRQNNLNPNSYNFNKNHDASPQTTFFNYRMPSEASTVGSKVEPERDNVRLNTDGRQNNFNHNSYNFNKNHNASPETTFFNYRMPSEVSTIRSKVEPESIFHHWESGPKNNKPSPKPYIQQKQRRYYPPSTDRFNHRTPSESKVREDSIQPSKLLINSTKETLAMKGNPNKKQPFPIKNHNNHFPATNIAHHNMQPKPNPFETSSFLNNTKEKLLNNKEPGEKMLIYNKLTNLHSPKNQNLNPKTESEPQITNISIPSKNLHSKKTKPFKMDSNHKKISKNPAMLKELSKNGKRNRSSKVEDIQHSPTETDFRRTPHQHILQKPARNTVVPQIQPKETFSKRKQSSRFSNLDDVFLSYPTIEASRYQDDPLHTLDPYYFEDNWQQHENTHVVDGDFPKYNTIPRTHFSCREKGSPGYYADPETGCQVFHMCHGSGIKHSFLCPNGTLFSQYLSVCDWHSRVQCEDGRSSYGVNKQLFNQPSITTQSSPNYNQYLLNYGWESKALPTRSEHQNHYFRRKGVSEDFQPRNNIQTRNHVQQQAKAVPQQTQSVSQQTQAAPESHPLSKARHTMPIPQRTLPERHETFLTRNQFKNNVYNKEQLNSNISETLPRYTSHQSYDQDIRTRNKDLPLENNLNRPKGFNYFTDNEYIIIHSEDPSQKQELKSPSPTSKKIKIVENRGAKTNDPDLANHRMHDLVPNIDVGQHKPEISFKQNTRKNIFKNSYPRNDKNFGEKQLSSNGHENFQKSITTGQSEHREAKSFKNSNHPITSQRSVKKQEWPKRDISMKENPKLKKNDKEFLRHISSDIIQKYAEHGVLFPMKTSKTGKQNHGQHLNSEIREKMGSSESPIYVYPLAGLDRLNNQTEGNSTRVPVIEAEISDKFKIEPRTTSFIKPRSRIIEKESTPTINITSRIRDIMSNLHTIGADVSKVLDRKESIYKNVQVHKLVPPKVFDAKILQTQILNSTEKLLSNSDSSKTKESRDLQLGEEKDQTVLHSLPDSSKPRSNPTPHILSNKQTITQSAQNTPNARNKFKITSTTVPSNGNVRSFITYVDTPLKIINEPNESIDDLKEAKRTTITNTESSKRREKPNEALLRKTNNHAIRSTPIPVDRKKQETNLSKGVQPNRVFYTNSNRIRPNLNRTPLIKARNLTSFVNKNPNEMQPLQRTSHSNAPFPRTSNDANLKSESFSQSYQKSTNAESDLSHPPIATKNLPAFIFTANHNPFPFKKDLNMPTDSHNPFPLKKDIILHWENRQKDDQLTEAKTTPVEHGSASPTPKTIGTTIPLPHLEKDTIQKAEANEKQFDTSKSVTEIPNPYGFTKEPPPSSTGKEATESEECDDDSKEQDKAHNTHVQTKTISEKAHSPELSHIFINAKPIKRPTIEFKQTHSNMRSNYGQRSKISSDLVQRKPYYVHEPPRNSPPKEMHHHHYNEDDGPGPETTSIKSSEKNSFAYPSKFRNQAQHMITESSEEHSSEQPPGFLVRTSENGDKLSEYAELEKAAEMAAMQKFRSNKKTSEER